MFEDQETAIDLMQQPASNINQTWTEFIRERYKQKYIDVAVLAGLRDCKSAEEREFYAGALPALEKMHGEIFEQCLKSGKAYELLDRAFNENVTP
tara:strand:- start:11979 stop:12263 length:285 start_codon:yes stop_codon:yes gene_type:complete